MAGPANAVSYFHRIQLILARVNYYGKGDKEHIAELSAWTGPSEADQSNDRLAFVISPFLWLHELASRLARVRHGPG